VITDVFLFPPFHEGYELQISNAIDSLALRWVDLSIAVQLTLANQALAYPQ